MKVLKSQISNLWLRPAVFRFLVVAASLFLTFNFQLSTVLLAQQPTSTAPLFEVNSHYLVGRTWADYKPSAGAGLTLNIAAGTAFCGNPPGKVVYAGGTLTMTNAATNYVFVNPAVSCVPASNTTGFTAGMIPLAQVVAAGGVITGVTDVRTWFVDPQWRLYTVESSVDLASVATGACTTERTVTVTGAALGNPVMVTAATALQAGTFLVGKVTAYNTTKWQFCNLSGGAVDRASDNYTVYVFK